MSKEENSLESSVDEVPTSGQTNEIEIEEMESTEEERKEEMNELINEFHLTKKNKDRAQILDLIGEFSTFSEVQSLLIDVALEDKYQLCRAKAVSHLAEFINEEDVKRAILQTLNDSSQQVRLWSIWALRGIIHDINVRDILVRKLKYGEVSNRVKLWIIRSLSDLINDLEVINTFISLLKSKPNIEMRKLLLYYILQKAENPEISLVLSMHIQKETNSEIRKEIVKKLIQIDNDDVNYELERLKKTEKNNEIIKILSTKF